MDACGTLVDINVTLSPSRKGGIDWSIGSTALASPLTGHLRLAAPVSGPLASLKALLVGGPALRSERRTIPAERA